MDSLWTNGFGVLLLVVGVYLVLHHRRSRLVLEASRSWPSVTGRIVQAEIKRKPGSDPSYEARIKYRYRVEGREYTSKAVTIGGKLDGSRARAERWLDRYAEGSEAEVFYDPDDRRVCCLERVHEGGTLELAAAAFGIVTGLALLLGLFS